MPCLMGFEHEYAVASVDGPSHRSPNLCGDLMTLARQRLIHLPDAQSGVFLASGARFYIDGGQHPEWCTPECDEPGELVNQVRAGEAQLTRLLRRTPRPAGNPQPVLLRHNVDYLDQGTWGSHESHLHRGPRAVLARALVPHLVSRIIYSGAGGLHPRNPGIAFVLSPRMAVLTHRSGPPNDLSHFMARDQSHAAAPLCRLHIPLGDTLCLDRPLWLRAASTSLLVTLIDAQALSISDLPALSHPVAALKSFNADPTLRAQAELADGSLISALELQRRILSAVQGRLGHSSIPPWAESACAQWRQMLDALERGCRSEACCCDWTLKFAIFTRQLDRAGLSWSDVGRLDRIHRSLCARVSDRDEHPIRAILRDIGNRAIIEAHMESLRSSASETNVNWNALGQMLRLRARLCELDVRFGQMPGGIAQSLGPEVGGAAPGVTRAGLRAAMRHPPQRTRAKIRGSCVKRLHKDQLRYLADWSAITDVHSRRRLDLSDPFAQTERWVDLGGEPRNLRGYAEIVSLYYNRGDYDAVRTALRVAIEECGNEPHQPFPLLPYLAWIQARTGDVAAAEQTLQRSAPNGSATEHAMSHAAIYRFRGLFPPMRKLAHWIRQCEQMLQSSSDCGNRVSLLGYKGHMLKCAGRINEAAGVFEESIRPRAESPNHMRLIARNQCELADCLRILGRPAEALRLLRNADSTFRRHQFAGERAEFYVTALARLQCDDRETVLLLAHAERMLTTLGNLPGAVRVLLLRARLASSNSFASRCRHKIEGMRHSAPDLQTCPKLNHVLKRWTAWTGDRTAKEHGDMFWCV